MTQLRLSAIALGALLVVGCGDNGNNDLLDGGLPQLDAAPQADANRGQDAPAGCGFAAVYDSLAFVATDVGTNSTGDPSNYVYFDGFLDSAANPDLLEIELVDGYGVFANGIKTGTFMIANDETNYGTCGLCLRLMSQVDPSTWEAGQYYMATSGTVTLTAVGSQIAGTLDHVRFTHVDINTETLASTPLDDGCTAQANAARFAPDLGRDGGVEDDDGGAGMPDGMHM